MKVNVEMTEAEYEEFKVYRGGKREEGREVAELRRDLRKLADAVQYAVELREKEHRAEVASYEDAEKLVKLAEELKWR